MEIDNSSDKILKTFSPWKVAIPVVLGLIVTIYLLYKDWNNNVDSLQNANVTWLSIALVVLVFRDLFYIVRIRFLTECNLTWIGSFYVILLWEFASALSPSAVGGTALAALLLMKEGISFGKSLAYVLVSAILDNLFFIIVGGAVIILNYLGAFKLGDIFPALTVAKGNPQIELAIQWLPVTFYVVYSIIAVYNFLMMYGLFVRPQAIRWLFIKITSLKWFRRWQKAAEKQGEELMTSSVELKGKKASYWIIATVSTILIWTSRYFIVNCLIASFAPIGIAEHSFILSRHVLLWIVMLIGITPGAAGIAEFGFTGFFTQFAPKAISLIAVLWRMVTYYPYLIFGGIALYFWTNRVFTQDPSSTKDEAEEPVGIEEKE